MKKKIVTIVLLLISWNVVAQSAQEYFNRAANEYIYKGDEVALNTIGTGLAVHPNDKPLTSLKEKIEKEKEQQEQEEKQNQEQDQQQEEEEQEQQEEEQKEQEGQEEEQEQGEQEENDDADQKEESEQAQEQETEEEGEEMEEPPQTRSEKLEELNLTEEKARMILEAMKNNEIQYIQQNQRKATKKPESGKPDW